MLAAVAATSATNSGRYSWCGDIDRSATSPANSTAGPGFVSIVFKAVVTQKPAPGTYPVSIQVTDSDQDQLYLVDAAPAAVSGVAVTARPSPTPGH